MKKTFSAILLITTFINYGYAAGAGASSSSSSSSLSSSSNNIGDVIESLQKG